MKYKFRAETEKDAEDFLNMLAYKNIRSPYHARFTPLSVDQPLPDVEVVLETDIPYDDIMNSLLLVNDSHVMIETIKPIEEYTGIRQPPTPEWVELNKVLKEKENK
jgi:hypothetical protein